MVLIAIQIPAVQNFARGKIVTYLEKKIQTKVEIGKLSIDFPKRIVLENIYFEDQAKDTLLAGKKIRVDIALLKLLNHTIELNYLELDGIRANIYRKGKDTAFNYQYIVDAFAGDQEATPTKASTPMTFHLDKIVLNQITTTFKDDYTGNDLYAYLGNFNVNIKSFEPDKSTYNVPTISLNNANIRFRQYTPLHINVPLSAPPADSANVSKATKLTLDKIDFTKVNFEYNNQVANMLANVNLGEFHTAFEKIDLSKLYISLRNLELKNSMISMKQGVAKTAGQKSVTVTSDSSVAPAAEWNFKLQNLAIQNNSINYDNNTAAPVASGMDFNHLHFTGFTIAGTQLSFSPGIFRGNINQLQAKEQSGLDLQKFQAGFYYTDTAVNISNMILQTDKTKLQDELHLNYASSKILSEKPGESFLKATISDSRIAAKDILLFAPQLKEQLKGNENAVFLLDTKMEGYVKNLSINNFAFSGYGNTSIKFSGKIQGLPDAKNANFAINLANLTTTKNDIEKLIPKGSLPTSIQLPQRITASGNFNGNIKNFTTKINAQTSIGNALVNAKMSNNGKSYNANISTKNFDLGYLLKQEKNIGKISLDADIKGSGLDYKTMNTDIHAILKEGVIKDYNYQNLLADISLKNGQAKITSSINDPNISYTLNGEAMLQNKFPAVKMDIKIDTLNVQALHLMADSLQLSGIIHADFASTNPDSLQGKLKLYDLFVTNNGQHLHTDTISMLAAQTDSGQLITLNSEMANVQWLGKYKLSETGKAVMHTINKYYKLPSFKDTVFTPQDWRMDMDLKVSPLVLQFQPKLEGTDSIHAKLIFSSADEKIDFSLKAPHIQYGEEAIENFSAFVYGSDNLLDYNIGMEKGGSKGFQLYQTSLSGFIADQNLITAILLKDKEDEVRYHFSTTFTPKNNGFTASLSPENALLNYEEWDVSKDNYIQYDSLGIIAHNFKITHNNQSLSINSQSQTPTAPVEVAFNDFHIKTLTDFADQDSLLMDGAINGHVIIKDIIKNPVFTSDLAINNFSYKTDTLGNINVKVDNETANAFNADIKITGQDNDVSLTGKYYTGEGNLDMQLAINKLNLASIRGFTAGQLDDAGGFVSGNFKINGNSKSPKVNGTLQFNDAFVTPTMLGEKFTLNNDKINVDESGIHFNQFSLTDTTGSEAILNGDVFTKDFRNYSFALNFKANNFNVVHSTQAENKMFYGDLNIDADIKVKGSLEAPSITANINANKETDFTFVLPSNNPEVVSREGVVNFVDKSAPKDTTTKIDFRDTLINTKAFAGMNVSANFTTDTAAAFTLVIDERNGDALKVQGGANLAGGVDESGKLSLTGNYELTNGSYQLTFNFLKRKFDIQRGSVITWTGDPTSAIVNITALYQLKAAPIDLVQPILAGQSENEINKYKQKIDVQVFLKMTGELLKPQISFDIALPNDELSQWSVVDGKLQQLKTDESELNKQVFALLLLGRFVGEDITQSAASTSTSTLVKQSVSKILTDQLNKLAGNLIQGVDLSFGLNAEDDYSTGTQQSRTDLTVGVSKSLLNDRLKVSVGSNFELESPSGTNRDAANIAGDVAIDYKLSEDGRYKIRGYRKNEYEGVVEGQVVETGLTFIYTLDYDHFKELFAKPDKKLRKKIKKQNKEAKEEKKEQQQETNEEMNNNP
ncbi:MAG: translocation/assembly module TamB domain-containing protein [Chitinophagaceae bacterium]